MEYNFNGCLPPKIDVRDYTLAKTSRISFPDKFVIGSTTIKNQGRISSCVAHATSSILEYYSRKILSTNFIYGIQKKECGHEGKGMYLRDACTIVKKYGDMLDEDCPGNDGVPDVWEVAEKAFADNDKMERAYAFRIKSYVSLKTKDDIKEAILNYGPVLGAVKWFNSFKYNSKTGCLEGEQSGDYGYHAIMIYGWDENGFLCQNSWGTGWGKRGVFTLPYSIPVAEAYILVDDENDGNIIQPKRNAFLDIIYNFLNMFLNFFKKS